MMATKNPRLHQRLKRRARDMAYYQRSARSFQHVGLVLGAVFFAGLGAWLALIVVKAGGCA